MIRIAITGLTGWIGGYVGSFLQRAGHEVIGISRQKGVLWLGRPVVSVPDLTDVHALAKAFEGCGAILHFADRADRRTYAESDVNSAARVVDAIRQAASDARVGRVVLASSVYADRDDRYGRSKRKMEVAGSAAGPCPRALILRLPPIHGPGAKGAVRHIARAVEKGWPLPFGMANAPRRFLSLEALADLCLHLVELDSPTFDRAAGRVWVPIDIEQGSLRALTQSLGAGGRRTRLVPVPYIDRLLAGRLQPGQLEMDRDALYAAVGWQART